jgi:hypothetical protein
MLCAGLALTLSAGAQTAPATGGQPAPGARPAYQPKNLKVLPDDTDLRKVMRAYSGALGVDCEFCHAAPDPVTHRADRASDANPMKDRARYMIQMTSDLNTKYLAQFPGHDAQVVIACGTCHRGEKQPPVFVPPPRQEGNRPAGAPPAAMSPAAPPPAR